MPIIPGWLETKPEQPGELKRMPAGSYVAALDAMEAVQSKKGTTYYRIPFVILEGEFAGTYDDDWGRDNPGLHSINLYVSNPKSIAISRGTLQTITDANPGFDADAAFQGDQFSMFKGRRVGVVLGEEEYEDRKTGDIKTSIRCRRVCSPEKAREDSAQGRVPDVKTMDGDYVDSAKYHTEKKASATTAAAVNAAKDVDVPF